MVLPREVLHKTYTWLPNQEDLDQKIITSQAFQLFKNANVHNEEIILKEIPIGALLVYNGYNTDLESITIYKCVKNLYHQDKPATQALLNLL